MHNSGHYSRSNEMLLALLDYSNDGWIFAIIAFNYCKQNHLKQAKQYLAKALQKRPQEPFFLMIKGDLELQQGKVEEALAIFGSLLQLTTVDKEQQLQILGKIASIHINHKQKSTS